MVELAETGQRAGDDNQHRQERLPGEPSPWPWVQGANTLTKQVRHFLDRADLVFGVGCSFTTNLASIGVPPGKTMVQCTVDARDINKEHRIDHAVIGDAKLVLGQLIEEVRKTGWDRMVGAGRRSLLAR